MVLSRNRLMVLLTGWAIALCGGSEVLGLTQVELVGADLQARPVQLLSLYEGVVQYFDAQRSLQSRGIDELLQMRVVGAATGQVDDEQGMVYLADGQRLRGVLSRVGDDGQTLYWVHDEIGEVALSLEVIRRVVLTGDGGDAVVPAAATNDRVVMVNGDVAEGFVVSLAGAAVELESRVGETLRLGLDRVAEIRLAVGDTGGAGDHAARVWLRDGSCVAAAEFSVSKDILRLRLGVKSLDKDAVAAVDMAAVRRIDFAAGTGRLVGLADCPMRVVSGGEVFGMTMLPAVDGSDLRLHGPVVVAFELPQGAQRVAGRFELADDNSGRRRWADVEVVVRSGGAVVAKGTLNDEREWLNVNVVLSEGQLRIELKEAKNGPVMDRVRVVGAVVYVVGE